MHRLGTVTGALTAEAVPLHGAGETFALGGTRHIDVAAIGEDLRGQLLPNLVLGRGIRVVQPQLRQVSAWVDAGGGVLTCQRLVDLAWLISP